jgi:hypothetical protein
MFKIYRTLLAALDPWVYSASNITENQNNKKIVSGE